MQSTRQADDAGKVAELEAAQAAAQGALLAEMDLLRRQKAASEEQARRMETQVCPPGLLCSRRLTKGLQNGATEAHDECLLLLSLL